MRDFPLIRNVIPGSMFILLATACNPQVFQMQTDSSVFQQNASSTNGKVDILFVIDNSASMAVSQQALADNISRFFDKFDSKNFDYQIAVTTTDAWRVQYGDTTTTASYRDGVGTAHTGFPIVKPTTPNRQQVFISNMMQGIAGNGDERAYQSIQLVMESASNKALNFPRGGSFFSVIVLSDADDLSATVSSTLDNGTDYYANPNLIPLSTYVNYLDTKFGVVNGARASKYSINTIGVLDAACETQLSSGGENKIGNRYMQMSDLTGGIKGSICGDFAATLSDISNKIIELTTQFYLGRPAVPETLSVRVNGATVPQIQATDPQPWNGFLYHSDTRALSFYGSFVPAAGAIISVDFAPATIK